MACGPFVRLAGARDEVGLLRQCIGRCKIDAEGDLDHARNRVSDQIRGWASEALTRARSHGEGIGLAFLQVAHLVAGVGAHVQDVLEVGAIVAVINAVSGDGG